MIIRNGKNITWLQYDKKCILCKKKTDLIQYEINPEKYLQKPNRRAAIIYWCKDHLKQTQLLHFNNFQFWNVRIPDNKTSHICEIIPIERHSIKSTEFYIRYKEVPSTITGEIITQDIYLKHAREVVDKLWN